MREKPRSRLIITILRQLFLSSSEKLIRAISELGEIREESRSRLIMTKFYQLFLPRNEKLEIDISDLRAGKLEKSLFIAAQPFSGTPSR